MLPIVEDKGWVEAVDQVPDDRCINERQALPGHETFANNAVPGAWREIHDEFLYCALLLFCFRQRLTPKLHNSSLYVRRRRKQSPQIASGDQASEQQIRNETKIPLTSCDRSSVISCAKESYPWGPVRVRRRRVQTSSSRASQFKLPLGW